MTGELVAAGGAPSGRDRGGLPPWTYRSDELTEIEKDVLFRRHWQLACHVSDVAEPGDYVAFDIAGERALILRDGDGRVRAFHNLCRHRGSRVVARSRGRCDRMITCPFHGWRYHFDGTLRGAAFPDSLPKLDRIEHGLKPVELDIWMGFVFVRFLPGGQPAVSQVLARHDAEVAPYATRAMVPAAGDFWTRELAVNWKAVRDVDNEGYHVPEAHPGLRELYGESYHDEPLIDGTARSFGRFTERPGRRWSVRHYKKILPERAELPVSHRRAWLYVGLFPNTVIAFYPDSTSFYQEYPIDARRTLLRGAAYRHPAECRALRLSRYLSGRIDRRTDQEDARLIEWTWEAMESSAFDGIVLSDREYGVRSYHDVLRAAIPVTTLRHAPARGTVAEANGRMLRSSAKASKRETDPRENPMSPPSNSAAAIRDYDNEHYLHPWDAMWLRGGADRTISARAEGIHVYTPDGKRLIDGPGGMWCTQIGYGRRDMADAIAEQVMQLSYHSPWNTASEPGALLAKKLSDLAPGDLNTVFFTTGGSTAVDTALRFVHFYNNRLGRPRKKVVLSREKAYHGSTYLAASVTGKERARSWFDVDGELTHLLPDVNPSLRPEGTSPEAWCDAKVADLEMAIAELGPDRVGAFIAEPVLASGGVIIPPPDYHRRCLEVCRAHDVLYISDEVVTGFGRLGHWFASEDVFGIRPDLITCAKGLTSGYLPLGACLISDRVLDPVSGPGQEGVLFANGYTYSGHPVSCAAALKNIEIFENEGILEHVRRVSPHFLERLHALGESPIVGDTRGLGLVGCVEGRLPEEGDRLALDREFGRRIDRRCEALGLIVRPLLNMCVFSPPLVITERQIDEMFDILEQAIRDVALAVGPDGRP